MKHEGRPHGGPRKPYLVGPDCTGRRQRTAAAGWSQGEALTPLQLALVDFGEALTTASTDERTLRVFLDVVSFRLAHEYGRRLEGQA